MPLSLLYNAFDILVDFNENERAKIMTVNLYLSIAERDILLNHLSKTYKNIRARLQLGVVDERGLSFDFEEQDFYELVDAVELNAAITDDKDLIVILTKLYDLLEEDPNLDPDYWDDEEEFEDDFEDEEEADEYGGDFEGSLDELTALGKRMGMPDKMVEEIHQKLLERQPRNEEELNAILEEVACAFSMHPMPGFDNLTPEEIQRMLFVDDWRSPDSAITLQEDIPPELLHDNIMLDNALLFLRMVHEQDGVKATAKGNLNRKFISAIHPLFKNAMVCGSEYDDLPTCCNEEHVPALTMMRHILELAGLLRMTKGMFRITRKGERMLAQEKMGALLALLFHTYYRKFNIAFVDTFDPCPSIQLGIVYSFLMLKRYASDLIAMADIKDKLYPPFVWEEISEKEILGFDLWRLLAETRIIKPLYLFGMIESDEEDFLSSMFEISTKIKTTPLFDALLEFKV